MFKYIITIICVLQSITCLAQTPQAKKAAASVFSLNTFKKDGTPLATSHGFFLTSDGEAIAPWQPFVGAAKAVVIDSNGKKYDVDGLIGANDLYNLCKFKVTGSVPSAPAAPSLAKQKETLYLACYNLKTPRLLHATVKSVETYSKIPEGASKSNDYGYYILDITAPEGSDYCPIVNNTGEVVALLQQSNSGTTQAISAKYPADFQFSALINASSTMAKSLIPTILPTEYKDAQVALLLAAQQKNDEGYDVVIEQFIRHFPSMPDGYSARAGRELAKKDFAASAADMEKAIAVATDKAEQHYAYSNLILQKEIYMPDDQFASWGISRAMSEIDAAIAISDMPIYHVQKAKIHYADQKYDEAYGEYMKVMDTQMKGPEIMLAALVCRQSAGASYEEQKQIMDSVIAICPRPLTYQSAPYIYQRGQLYQNNNDYRKAMGEYNEYERLMVGHRLPAEFYYNRFICEREGRVYQAAINDIDKAISLNQYEPAYYCEKGSLILRFSKFDEAIECANKCILINSNYPDAYAILGTAQCLKGQKHEGLLNLERAKSLGYQAADALIAKYKK